MVYMVDVCDIFLVCKMFIVFDYFFYDISQLLWATWKVETLFIAIRQVVKITRM